MINRATPGRDLRWLSFVIRPQARLGARLAAALWHTPEHAPAPIEWEELDDGRLRILLPRVPLWGVAELKFEDGPCQGRKSTPGESNP